MKQIQKQYLTSGRLVTSWLCNSVSLLTKCNKNLRTNNCLIEKRVSQRTQVSPWHFFSLYKVCGAKKTNYQLDDHFTKLYQNNRLIEFR